MKSLKKTYKINLNFISAQIIYLLIIFVLVIVSYNVNSAAFYIALTLFLISAIIFVYSYLDESKNKKYRINELSKSVDIVLKNNLSVINIPMVMISSSNQLVWQNDLSKAILPKEYIFDVYIQLEKKFKAGEELRYISDIGNGTLYNALASFITFSNFNCMLISFIDKTEEINLKKHIDETKVTFGIVFIDNYEETFQGLDEIQKSEITSKIDKILRSWVKESSGIITKLDKDRYAVFIEKQYIEQMEKTKFAVLDLVKEVTTLTKLPVTISIGLSNNENNLSDRYTASTSALDIALGRGGDQVVIRKDKKFDFYGGSNIILDKTSRVRARTIAFAISDILDKSDKVYVMGHKNFDVDCIGASVGITEIAKSLGKKAYVFIDNKVSASSKLLLDRIETLDSYEDVFVTKEDVKKHDFEDSVLIIVDTHKKSYLTYPELFDEFEKVIIIDHHRRGPEFIDNAVLTYHEIYASSTSELVTELIMYMEDIKLGTIHAEALYSGILVDTKNFTFKTGVRTFEVAAYLKKSGLDISEIKQIFQNDFESYLAKVEIVKNAEIIDKKIAISICTQNHENMSTLVAQAADELLSISGIIASFVICKIDNVIMISSRSMGDINVQLIMEKIGGGGHLTFAGAQLTGISIEEAKAKLINIIKEYNK